MRTATTCVFLAMTTVTMDVYADAFDGWRSGAIATGPAQPLSAEAMAQAIAWVDRGNGKVWLSLVASNGAPSAACATPVDLRRPEIPVPLPLPWPGGGTTDATLQISAPALGYNRLWVVAVGRSDLSAFTAETALYYAQHTNGTPTCSNWTAWNRVATGTSNGIAAGFVPATAPSVTTVGIRNFVSVGFRRTDATGTVFRNYVLDADAPNAVWTQVGPQLSSELYNKMPTLANDGQNIYLFRPFGFDEILRFEAPITGPGAIGSWSSRSTIYFGAPDDRFGSSCTALGSRSDQDDVGQPRLVLACHNSTTSRTLVKRRIGTTWGSWIALPNALSWPNAEINPPTLGRTNQNPLGSPTPAWTLFASTTPTTTTIFRSGNAMTSSDGINSPLIDLGPAIALPR